MTRTSPLIDVLMRVRATVVVADADALDVVRAADAARIAVTEPAQPGLVPMIGPDAVLLSLRPIEPWNTATPDERAAFQDSQDHARAKRLRQLVQWRKAADERNLRLAREAAEGQGDDAPHGTEPDPDRIMRNIEAMRGRGL